MLTKKYYELTPEESEPKIILVHNMNLTTISNMYNTLIIASNAWETRDSNIGLEKKSQFIEELESRF